ncbi:hypothetical protein FRC01_010503, partial [Tulasnella sp. 417]
MTALRSNDGPLSILYAYPWFGDRDSQTPPKEFLATVVHLRSRWSEYCGPVVPEYLEAPAPLLQKIRIWDDGETERDMSPLELLGGFATGLQYVDLDTVSLRWRMGMFSQLKSLKLQRLKQGGFKTSHLLDFLRESPGLQQLKLRHLHAITDNTTASNIITLSQLQSIILSRCGINVIESILRQSFHGILRAIHQENGVSNIQLDESEFEWYTSATPVKGHRFRIYLHGDSLIPGICWAQRVLGNNPGLQICFPSATPVAVLETIAPMRCITKVLVGEPDYGSPSHQVFEFLAQPLSTDPSLPSLPALQDLRMAFVGWNLQDLFDMVHSRFELFSWKTMKRPSLVIKVPRGSPKNGSPPPISDPALVTRIMETSGVERFEFYGPKERDGSLAVVWDEEASKPVWS